MNKKQTPSTTTLIAVLLSLALSGCSGSGNTGTPQEDTPQESASTSEKSSEVLAKTDPCSVIPDNESEKLGITSPGKQEEKLGSRTCEWEINTGNLTIAFHEDRSLDELEFPDAKTTEEEVGDRESKLVHFSQGSGQCEINIAASKNEALGISVLSDDMTNKTACDVAKKAAPMVEQNIPES